LQGEIVILGVHHPKSITETLELLNRKEIMTYPIGGGTSIENRITGDFDVTSLNQLDLNTIEVHGNFLEIGSTATIQNIFDYFVENQSYIDSVHLGISRAIDNEADITLRREATLAGILVSSDGLSRLATTLMALDSELIIEKQDGQYKMKLGNLLQFPGGFLKGQLITKLLIPVRVKFNYDEITGSDGLPLVSIGIAVWQSGRTRVILGGYGSAPSLAFDGTEKDGIEIVVRNLLMESGDKRAAAEKRSQYAGELVRKILLQV